ncbi:TPA: hypothetical protein ENS27_06775, partial [bacterium]|nr:hypothetical protein [bacterium]
MNWRLLNKLILIITPWRYKNNQSEKKLKYSTIKVCLYCSFISVIFLILLLLFAVVSRIFFPLPMYRLKPMPSVVVYDRNGKILRGFTAPDEMWRINARIDEVSPRLRAAVLNYEDRWFRFHPGFNPISIIRAGITNAKAGQILCGGSTITMQVARMMEPKPRTIKSKLIEL